MGICYFCGKEVENPSRCPYCNITYCDEHLPPEKHKCLAAPKPPPTPRGIPPQRAEAVKPLPKVRPRKPSQRSRPTARLALLVAILVLSLASIVTVNWLGEEEPEGSTAGPLFPVSEETLELQRVVLELVNRERARAKVAPLVMGNGSMAQRHAEELLRRGALANNPNLPVDMGENIKDFHGEVENITRVLEQMVREMVYEDQEADWGNKRNILNPDYTELLVGVAFTETEVYLVLDFK